MFERRFWGKTEEGYAQIDVQATRGCVQITIFGERKKLCVADSFGKVYGHEGLFISDGSMLPSAPGVNPQGTIMAFAHRNIEKIISES